MKTIKFIKKDSGEFTATLRRNVNEYFRTKKISSKGNAHMLVKASVMLGLYFVPFILMLCVPLSGWLFILLWMVMGAGMAGTGMSVMHDAVHGSFSSKQWVNKLFGSSMYFLGGNIFNWKVQHNVLHHTFTNVEGFDEDIEPKGVLRLSAQSPLKKIHRFQYLYAFALYSLMTLSRTFKEFSQLRDYNKRGITRQQGAVPGREMMRLVLVKIAYFVVIFGLPLLFSSFGFWMILAGFLMMHAVGGIVMSTVFQMAHVVEEAAQPQPDDKGVIHSEWAVHELETTANFAPRNKVLGWAIGGLNYQVEHHLFPNICHVHYPEISPIVKQTAQQFGLSYHQHRSFTAALRSHVRMLKRLGNPAV